MSNFSTDKIRNICLIGHGDAGKTTFADAMLFNAGVIDRPGKIADGSTVSDYDSEEIKRAFSINAAMTPFEWKNTKVNIIDTPGFFDFVGEVHEAVRVADAAIVLLSGRSGVSVGTEQCFDYAQEKGIPVAFFVNKMDHERANFHTTLEDLKAHFGSSVAPFQLPLIENGTLSGIIDIINMKAYKADGAKLTEISVPADAQGEIEETRSILIEAVAETDEALMEKFFAGEDFTAEELTGAIKASFKQGLIMPVFCGAAGSNLCITPVMDAIADYFPAPSDMPEIKAKNAKGDGEVTLNADPAGPLAALVFKTIADPFVGKISLFRVYSGTMKPDTSVLNSSKGVNEKIGKVIMLRGKKQVDVSEATAGDIAAVTKLSETVTGDTLCSASNPVILDGISFPAPCISMAIMPKSKNDEGKISTGLQRLAEEDPTFKTYTNAETHQTLVSGIGEQHLDIIVNKLKGKFGVEVDLKEPRNAYRETIRKKVKVQGRHKKQSGGAGQFGDVWIEFEPGETEELIFETNIFGGSVPKNYFPAVEKGLRECVLKGVLAGYPVINLKATLVDGSYHPVDSNDMSFKIAASLAYKAGLVQASPVILEPIGKLEVICPDSMMGDIIGDVNKRRGRVLGMNPAQKKGCQLVEAEVPMSEMNKYATDLRSMTQGRASFSLEFVRYEEAPANVAQTIIEKSKLEEE